MSKLWMQQILPGLSQPVSKPSFGTRTSQNPFARSGGVGQSMPNEPGLNQPLRNPMFVGYRDNKPIYAGSRLYVLY